MELEKIHKELDIFELPKDHEAYKLDGYTFVFRKNRSNYKLNYYEFYSLQGHGECQYFPRGNNKHLGNRVKFEQLPKDIQEILLNY